MRRWDRERDSREKSGRKEGNREEASGRKEGDKDGIKITRTFKKQSFASSKSTARNFISA